MGKLGSASFTYARSNNMLSLVNTRLGMVETQQGRRPISTASEIMDFLSFL